MSARSFTEIEPTRSQVKVVLMPRMIPDTLFCSHVELSRNGEPKPCLTDSFSDHYPCGVCGAYYCEAHIDPEKSIGGLQGGTNALCLSCAQLTRDEQEEVIALRKAIEKG